MPYQLVGQQLDVRATETTIEVMRGLSVLTSHARSYLKGKYTTKDEHMPKAHQAQAKWTPERLVEWAKKTGPNTAALVENIMSKRVHPQHGFQACLGILHLDRDYKACPHRGGVCGRALKMRACTCKSVKAILRNNLDQQPLDESPQQALPLHDNVRGGGYYN